MGFLSKNQLSKIGFKKIGSNVLISDKATFYNPELMEIGSNSRIDDFCVLSGKIIIGKNVHIGSHGSLNAGKTGIFMDDFSGLAYNCVAFAESDDYSGNALSNPTVPKKYLKITKKPIHLKKHALVGASSVISPGCIIEVGSAVGSMSFVTKSIEPWSIYVGIPAKKVSERSKKLLELEKKFNDEK